MSGEELIEAAKNGDLILVKKLLDQGVPVDFQDERGKTALIYAMANGRLEIVRELIKAGASSEATGPRLRSRSSLDLQNKWEKTTLMYAAGYGNLEIVRDSAD